MLPSTALLLGLVSVAAASPVPEAQPQGAATPAGLTRQNDWNCKSASHPSPVVLLHGLFATEDLGGLNFLEIWLRAKGFCTFAITYGEIVGLPLLGGGVKSVEESSREVADFIREVHSRTGAAKVDLVGHSEGGFQSFYTTKFRGVAPLVDNIVAIAPPTHGTTLSNIFDIAYIGGKLSRDIVFNLLKTVGCGACADFALDGPGVKKLTEGPIAQQGNNVTVIATRFDEIVTPPTNAFVEEPGVTNIFVQAYCPRDPVGHIGATVDPNVWNLVLNSLEKQTGRPFFCLAGPRGR